MSEWTFVAEICRLLIGLTLSFAASGKTLFFAEFTKGLAESFELTSSFSRALGLGVVLAEATLALFALMAGPLRYYALLGAMGLFATFTLVILVSLIRARVIRCNCFGRATETISYTDVVRNLALISACIFYLLQDTQTDIALEYPLIGLGIALILFLVITNLHHIALVVRDPKEN